MQDSIDLDSFDLKLLAALQAAGNATNQELAERVGLSASQCSRRRQRLEESGVIRGYRVLLDREKLGYDVTVFIAVVLATHSRLNAGRFRKLVAATPLVQEAYALTGDADYLLKLSVPDLKTLSALINEVLLPHESVERVRSSIVLDTIKEDGHLPLG